MFFHVAYSKVRTDRPQMLISGSSDASDVSYMRSSKENSAPPSYNVKYYNFDRFVKGPLEVNLNNHSTVVAFYGLADAYFYSLTLTNTQLSGGFEGETTMTGIVVSREVKTVTNWFFKTLTERAELVKDTPVIIGVTFPVVTVICLILIILGCCTECDDYSYPSRTTEPTRVETTHTTTPQQTTYAPTNYNVEAYNPPQTRPPQMVNHSTQATANQYTENVVVPATANQYTENVVAPAKVDPYAENVVVPTPANQYIPERPAEPLNNPYNDPEDPADDW